MSEQNAFGFLVCDKPYGMTSRDLVNRVQRGLRETLGRRKLKLGHTGTLDPLATGVVVVAVGAATRLTPWVLQHHKTYEAEYRFGASSPSGDLEEEVTTHPDLPVPTESEIQQACESMRGSVEQTPPAYSAIWIDGRRAHERKRAGEDVEVPSRTIWIESIELLSFDFPIVRLRVTCGSGTYLRTLGMDIAEMFQTRAVMTNLIRTQVGPFRLTSAIDPENEQSEIWLTKMIAPIDALAHLKSLSVSPDEATDIRNGLSLPPERLSIKDYQECVAIDDSGQLIAVMRFRKQRWFPYRVFPAESTHPQSAIDRPRD